MPEALHWVLAAVAGGTIGALHLGGLWATVRRLPTSRHRVLLTVGSFLVRLVLAGVGFLVILGGDRDAVRLLVALAGFVAVRTVLVWRVQRGALASSQVASSPSASSSSASSEVQP